MACASGAPNKAIMEMLEHGGQELVMEKNNKDQNNALYIACFNEYSAEVIMKMIGLGGHELACHAQECHCIESCICEGKFCQNEWRN